MIGNVSLETGDTLSNIVTVAIDGVSGFLNLRISMEVPIPISSAQSSITITFDSRKYLQFMLDGAAIVVQ